MTNVGILSNSWEGGGAEISMQNLNKNFALYGIKSRLIVVNCAGNCQHSELYDCLKRNKKNKFKDFIVVRKNLKKLIKDKNIMIVNCELPEFLIATIKSKNFEMYVIEHTTRPWNKRRTLGYLVRLILKIKKVKWVKVNKEERKIWPFSDDFAFIPNIVTNTDNNVLKNEKSFINLTFIGRLDEGKNARVVCEVARNLNLPLNVYGDGYLFDELNLEYGPNPGIKFYGYEGDAWKSISNNSLIIVPSKYEGDGLVVVESIIRSNPLLLADNEDLRRFGLPEKFYFKSQDDLESKIMNAFDNGIEGYRPPDNIVSYYREERAGFKIVSTWIKILNLAK
jgi:hypothetical protein